MYLYCQIWKQNKLFFLLYVDNIIIAADNKHKFKKLRDILMHEFLITDMKELHNYLEIKIEIQHNGIFLS